MTASFLAASVAVLVLLLAPVQVWAIDLNQWVSGLKAQVYVTERLEYESNVFQVRSRSKDDLISRTAPGFLITYDKGPVSLGAGYRAEILRFFDLEEQDNEHHFGTVRFGLNFPRIVFNYAQDIALTSDPPNTELTGRTDTSTVAIAPEFEYKLTPRFSVGVNYGFNHVQYETRAQQLNKDEHVMGGSVFWKFLPKSDVYFRYNWGYSEYDNLQGFTDRDVEARHIYLVGVRGDITPKLTSSFRIGYELREYQSESLGEQSSLIMGGETTFRPTDRSRLAVITSRTYQDSIFGQTLLTATFVSTSVTMTAEQQLATKIRVNGRVMYIFNEYPNKDLTATERPRFSWRDDTIWGWGGGVDYDIQKWLTVGAEYAHQRRDSTFPEFNYKDDKITAKLTLQF